MNQSESGFLSDYKAKLYVCIINSNWEKGGHADDEIVQLLWEVTEFISQSRLQQSTATIRTADSNEIQNKRIDTRKKKRLML